MNKNLIWILLIFLIPLGAYFWLTHSEATTQPAVAAGDEIIKFASPMCLECQDLEKVIDKVFPKYNDKVVLHKIDVSKKDKNCKALIKEYNVTLVPTTVFKNQDGRILRQIVGTMEPELLESYVEELIRE